MNGVCNIKESCERWYVRCPNNSRRRTCRHRVTILPIPDPALHFDGGPIVSCKTTRTCLQDTAANVSSGLPTRPCLGSLASIHRVMIKKPSLRYTTPRLCYTSTTPTNSRWLDGTATWSVPRDSTLCARYAMCFMKTPCLPTHFHTVFVACLSQASKCYGG